MLQQIWNTVKIDSLSLINGQTNSSLFLITICILTVLIIFFLLLRHKKKQKLIATTQILHESESDKAEEQKISTLKTIESEDRIESQRMNYEINVNKPFEGNVTIVKPELITLIEEEEEEEHSKEKYIGYNPINIFTQTEPLNYPYVLMPKPICVIKFPRKGRTGRKGYKEEDFKTYIERYFRNSFQVFDDRFILTKNSKTPFEPDFTLIDEKDGINIFIDIEIDEPYEGLSDIKKRKATHYQYSDNNRNNAFKNRGWVVIRFAEIQVHHEPNSCCCFIADVIKSINSKFQIPDSLLESNKVTPVKQWTKTEAEQWSIEKYRENYLGIESFGITQEKQVTIIEEIELGDKIEEKVQDEIESHLNQPAKQISTNYKLEQIYSAINSNKYLSFKYQGIQTITKPIKASDTELIAFCYIKNCQKIFYIYEMSNVILKDNYFTLRVACPVIGLDSVTSVVNTAIDYQKHIRMKYTRASWTNMFVDPETGELLLDKIEAEESIRTINNVQLSINSLTKEHIELYRLNSSYITAYCNKRDEQRTFRFDRIGEIEILDL